ncbi:MAG: AfsA-related hotdog domain-containing protein [Candidatus Gracilibacteria bacterium]|nr:AfsA-related hotdog domain-containing protein [Candidatus Gracilibacteria bacterium]
MSEKEPLEHIPSLTATLGVFKRVASTLKGVSNNIPCIDDRSFLDHHSRTHGTSLEPVRVHKTRPENVIIGIPFRQGNNWRVMLNTNKSGENLYEDPPLPIIEGTYLIEACNQLGSYVLDEFMPLFKVCKLLGMEKFMLSKSILKGQKKISLELGNIEYETKMGMTLGRYRVLIINGTEVIGCITYNFSIQDYTRADYETDITRRNEGGINLYQLERIKKYEELKNPSE